MKDTDGLLNTQPASAVKIRPQSGSLAAMLETPGAIQSAVQSCGHKMPVPVIEGAAADRLLATKGTEPAVNQKPQSQSVQQREVCAGTIMKFRPLHTSIEKKVTVIQKLSGQAGTATYKVIDSQGRAYKASDAELY